MLKKSWLSFKRRCFPYLFAYSAKMIMRLLLKTCRIKIHGLEAFKQTAATSPCILMLWHRHLLVIPEILNSYAGQFVYTAFISKSRDGDPLALLAQSYQNGRALRVPHNGRHLALNQLIESVVGRKEIAIITPDGPRGPNGIVKPGIVFAARETGARIVPFSWKANTYWQLKTWDQMKIPKPFTTLEVTFGPPRCIAHDVVDYDKETQSLRTCLENN